MEFNEVLTVRADELEHQVDELTSSESHLERVVQDMKTSKLHLSADLDDQKQDDFRLLKRCVKPTKVVDDNKPALSTLKVGLVTMSDHVSQFETKILALGHRMDCDFKRIQDTFAKQSEKHHEIESD